MDGRSLAFYRAPLFLAWQLTNGCPAWCLGCCEESGPDKAWPDELSAREALRLTADIVEFGIPYVAFGGGEPLHVPHVWDIFARLAAAGVGIKLETNGVEIDAAAAARLHALRPTCVQISLDGATAATHDRMRPGSPFAAALAAVDRLAALGTPPQWVFVPTRANIDELVAAFEMARARGCSAFVTGPLMRLGRAAADWARLAVAPADWEAAVARLRARAAELGAAGMLAVYPWDIVTELAVRLASPQAMMLVVPNGKVKLLNALPFAPADLRRCSLAAAWDAYRAAWQSPLVADFVRRCAGDPALLRHANETWELQEAG